MPTGPGMKVTGTNTAVITSVMAMIAPLISFITSIVARYGERCFSCIFACTASTTTIASLTTTPIANTSAKSVIRLIDSPSRSMTKNVPINDTGTARVGINVERQSPKNKKTTNATSTKASNSVCTTFSIDASKKLDTS